MNRVFLCRPRCLSPHVKGSVYLIIKMKSYAIFECHVVHLKPFLTLSLSPSLPFLLDVSYNFPNFHLEQNVRLFSCTVDVYKKRFS